MRGAVAMVLVACASPAAPVALADAAREVETTVEDADAGGEVLLPAGTPIRCGPGPYVRFSQALSSGTTKKPLVGIRAGTSACPGVFTETDENGRYTIFHTFGTKYSLLLHLNPYHGHADGELAAHLGGDGASQIGQFLGTRYKLDGVPIAEITPAIIPNFYWNAAVPECSPNGIKLSVEGAPGARVNYFRAGETTPTGESVDVDGGFTFIDRLPSSGPVVVHATHPTCGVKVYQFDEHTGRTLLFPGYQSWVNMRVEKRL